MRRGTAVFVLVLVGCTVLVTSVGVLRIGREPTLRYTIILMAECAPTLIEGGGVVTIRIDGLRHGELVVSAGQTYVRRDIVVAENAKLIELQCGDVLLATRELEGRRGADNYLYYFDPWQVPNALERSSAD